MTSFAVIHGLGEHSRRYERFAMGMARHGFATFAVDLLVHSKISSRLYSEWGAACKAIFERAGEIKVPFLILAGTDDRLIDPAGSEELHSRCERASTLRLFDGRYHEPFNDVDSEEVFGVIADWLSA